MEYGGWLDWCLCLGIAIYLCMPPVNSLEKIKRVLQPLSPLRKAFGLFCLISIPYFISVAFGEQAASPMNPQAPIVWFTAAAVNAILFLWLCEELVATRPLSRIIFLVVAGTLIVLALQHQVHWANSMSFDAANKIEIEEARNCKNEVNRLRDQAMTTKLYSMFTAPSAKPPEAAPCPPKIATPKSHKTPQSLPPESESPVQLSAAFYNPQAPSIVVSNPSDHVAENVNYGMVLFRTSDLALFSFSTQTIGYVKPRESTAPYLMPTTPGYSENNARIADGDELTGSVSIDCPKCKIQTYIIHLVWGHNGWFYESPQKAGYVVPKDMSKDGRAKYIQLLTSDIFAKQRTEIVAKQP